VWRSAALAVAVALPLAAYNLWAFGTLAGPYAYSPPHAELHGVTGLWTTPLAEGLLGVLVSPSRGLLVYSPVLVFALGGVLLLRRAAHAGLMASLAVGLGLSLVLIAKYSVWWGGHAFGPRLATELLPALVLLLLPTVPWLEARRGLRVAFAVLALVSVGIQGIGVLCYPSPRDVDWNTSPRDVDLAHDRLWDWRDPQLLRLLRHGPRLPSFDPAW
jgi:hypothetical protein